MPPPITSRTPTETETRERPTSRPGFLLTRETNPEPTGREHRGRAPALKATASTQSKAPHPPTQTETPANPNTETPANPNRRPLDTPPGTRKRDPPGIGKAAGTPQIPEDPRRSSRIRPNSRRTETPGDTRRGPAVPETPVSACLAPPGSPGHNPTTGRTPRPILPHSTTGSEQPKPRTEPRDKAKRGPPTGRKGNQFPPHELHRPTIPRYRIR